jgi:predicted enzyme related to lactoylglutathione lyase
MMKRQKPQQPNINYIDVKLVDEYSSKVEKIGGKAVVPKREYQEWELQFASTQKTTLSLYGSLMRAPSE